MKLKVVTPEKLVLDQEADSVTLPGSEGQMTILPGHAAMIALLRRGIMVARSGEAKANPAFIEEGAVEVLKNEVVVMTKGWQISEATPSPR
ncbi:MAG: ATP synthase F1 subunit epsilon [Deltaproteobacteria bacterium]|nr:ATP synthase F1 subunit epsilon [Deltaproteobacteria bacterium]